MERSFLSKDETNAQGTVKLQMPEGKAVNPISPSNSSTPMKPSTLNNSTSPTPFTLPANRLHDPKDWLTLKEAAHFLSVSRRTVLRMTDTTDRQTGRSYLRMWRPTPGTVMVCRRSLEEFCRMTQSDPEFWQKRARERRCLSASAVMRRVRRRRCTR